MNHIFIHIKYNQVARILTPIVTTLDKLESLETDPALHKYIENEYGGVEKCRKDILCKSIFNMFYKKGERKKKGCL
jgi:hypothetical protein